MKIKTQRILYESLEDIKKDIDDAFQTQDRNDVIYHLLRVIRLKAKITKTLKEKLLTQVTNELMELVELNEMVEKITAQSYQKLAFMYGEQQEIDKTEREWLAVVTNEHAAADDYIQYAIHTLRNNEIHIDRDIKDMLETIHEHNVSQSLAALKRAKFAYNAAVAEQGNNEATSYPLAWIDQLEKGIYENKQLIASLQKEEKELSVETELENLNRLIGLTSVKQRINEIKNWVSFNRLRQEKGYKTERISLHKIFAGNPGTGKTTVARHIAKIYKALGILSKGHLVEVGRSDLVAEYVGQTAVKTMKQIKKAKGGILFIDEAYSLSRGQGNDFGIEAIDTIVKAMEDMRDDFVVILAGYPNEMEQFIQMNPGLQSRFKYQIHFHDYSLNELMQINELLLKDRDYKMTEGAQAIMKNILTSIVAKHPKTHGNGRLVRNIIEDAILNKATYVMTTNNNASLDTIEEVVMKMVEASILSSQHEGNYLQHKLLKQ